MPFKKQADRAAPSYPLRPPCHSPPNHILAHHSSLLAAIGPGTIRWRPPGREVQPAAASPGMVKVEANEVLVLVDSAERPEEIDEARARREADQAREAILQKKSRQEHQLAQAALARALNRLRVKGHGIYPN